MSNKPIRYWETMKIYKWGCPRCDYTTFHETILCMHTIKEHDLNIRENIMTGRYILRKMKK